MFGVFRIRTIEYVLSKSTPQEKPVQRTPETLLSLISAIEIIVFGLCLHW